MQLIGPLSQKQHPDTNALSTSGGQAMNLNQSELFSLWDDQFFAEFGLSAGEFGTFPPIFSPDENLSWSVPASGSSFNT